MNILQPSSSWFLSGFLYECFSALCLCSFMPFVGRSSRSYKENIVGAVLGSTALTCTIILVMLAQLSDIDTISTLQIPSYHIASSISPALGAFFTVIILMGIYTGASPMYWNFCTRVIPERSKYYAIFVITLGVVGLLLGSILPFDKVINVVYLIFGWAGAVFFFVVLAKILGITDKLTAKLNKQQLTEDMS